MKFCQMLAQSRVDHSIVGLGVDHTIVRGVLCSHRGEKISDGIP